MNNFVAMFSISRRLVTCTWKTVCRTLATGSNPEVSSQSEILSKLREKFHDDIQNQLVVPIFKKALLYDDKIALKDSVGEYSYLQLYLNAKRLSYQVSNICGSGASTNVAYFCPKNVLSTIAQWACWISGQVAMPLNSDYPFEMHTYFIKDSGTRLLIATPASESIAEKIAATLDLALLIVDHSFLISTDEVLLCKSRLVLPVCDTVMIEGTLNNDFYTNSDALLLYSSGTTGKPKGVVLSHRNLDAQMECLTNAWKISASDCFLHVLPLNHIHGCVNALLLPLNVGAKVVMHESFNSHNVWSTLLGINIPIKDRVNVLMAVPTIYNRLIAEYDKIFLNNSQMVEYIKKYCKSNMRLMVSGSASLPIPLYNRWHEITGHNLLERYGMTEIGMALSNPYVEEICTDRKRHPGTVGMPLPNVKVRIVNADNKVLLDCKGEKGKGFWAEITEQLDSTLSNKEEETCKSSQNCGKIVGELHIAGPNVFREYYNRPTESTTAFIDGYFKTGDIGAFEDGVFKILGRANMDIINTGGFLVSSLEVESLLLNYPGVEDVVVVGIPDEIWGERVCAICVLKPKAELDLQSLKKFCSKVLPSYEHPTLLQIVNEIPRNKMSKVNKIDIIKNYLNGVYLRPGTKETK